MSEFSHIDNQGQASMVDVTQKQETAREAVATGRISMNRQTLERLKEGRIEKGAVLETARIAGIMAVKNTADLIPMCHQLLISGIDVEFELMEEEETGVLIRVTVRTTGKTGVEMEALTGVSTAALTIYDMCKAVDRGMEIGDIRLMKKTGGSSGTFYRGEETV